MERLLGKCLVRKARGKDGKMYVVIAGTFIPSEPLENFSDRMKCGPSSLSWPMSANSRAAWKAPAFTVLAWKILRSAGKTLPEGPQL